ncbi:potassium channel family protein [Cyclobacterium jeungdonense]|uniref:NAD-binding protein n=1 Tax=Cyclobacterium jeungdonense TaxID=708087 RepID=A0ABT8C2I2_9BACT|nr:NAD-binding protein [Cyclobacterium jeungdonense]MDN3686993.1 NAD-binding protein [Cyclobacterium jeungdonense]
MQNNLIKRITFSVLVVAAIIVVYAEIFSWSMTIFENRDVTFPQALQVVVESLTTSGYGGFSPWESDFLNYFVLIMNLTGVLLVFIAFPVFFLPFLKGALEKSPPTTVSKKGHVIICSYSTHAEVLIKELVSRSQDYVIIESGKERAKDLYKSGLEVLLGNPELESTLEAAGLTHAKTVVLNSTTDKNISILFSIRDLHKSVRIIAVLDDEEMEKYYKLAGADSTISPRQLIGKSLAVQVPAILINDSVTIDNSIELIEIDIEEGSELCDQSIGEAHLLDSFGINIIGAWQNGTFQSPVSPDLILKSKLRLLVAGERDELAKLNKKAEATIRRFVRNKVLIVGFGLSGKAAFSVLKTKSIEVKIIDIRDKEGVHIVGDIRDTKTLQEAGIADASAMIITIQDDTIALFATLLARSMNNKTHIIVRANNIENVKKLYNAGADYVQSLATVSGRMLASHIFEDETSLAAEKQINLVQLPAGNLSGTTLAKSNVRAVTGCTILAVIREGEKISALDPESFQFRDQDEVIVAGTDESIRQFQEMYVD